MSTLPQNKVSRGSDIAVIGTQVRTALSRKQDSLVSGENIKTICGEDILGAGDLDVFERGGDYGKAYVVLKRNRSFESQVVDEDTIYEIRYDFDLSDSQTTQIPSGCVLNFVGGSLYSGTIDLNNCEILGTSGCFGENLEILGKTSTPAKADWFKGYDPDIIEKAINTFHVVHLSARDYLIDRQIDINTSFSLIGESIPDNFGKSPEYDYSCTRLIATNASIGSILSIYKEPGYGQYKSCSIEHVSFTTSTSITRKSVNGIAWSTAGGPSRPLLISCCNFKYLNYGIYIYGSTSSNSTNLYTVKLLSSNFSINNWGIYVSGNHAVGGFLADSCVIEQNVNGGIYAYDSSETPVFGTFAVINCLMEGQETPIYIKTLGSVVIKNNYFERTGNNCYVRIYGTNNTLMNDTYISGNYHSSNGASYFSYYLNKCRVRELCDTGTMTYKIQLSYSLVYSKIFGNLSSCTASGFLYELDDVPYDEPVETCAFTPNYIWKGTPILRSMNSGYTQNENYRNYTKTISAGDYRLVFYAKTSDATNTFTLRDLANSNDYEFNLFNAGGSVVRYVHDVTLSAISGTNKLQFGYRNRAGGNGAVIGSGLAFYEKSGSKVPNLKLSGMPLQSYTLDTIINPTNGDTFKYGTVGKIVTYRGTWKDSDGYTVALKSGTTSNRPTLESTDIGYTYFDTTVGKPIFWNGSSWVDSAGSSV